MICTAEKGGEIWEVYEDEILDVYRRCGIREFPIDCARIIRTLGFSLVSYGDLAKNPEEYKRLCLYSNDAFTIYDNQMMVCYNQKANHGRIRFSLMHEIGHFVLQTDDEEKADKFAANILAPPAIILDRRINDADQIRKLFDVSITAANHAVISSIRYDRKAGERIASYFRSFTRDPEYLNVSQRKHVARTKPGIKYNQREAWLLENYPGFSEIAFIERERNAYFPFG